MPVQTEVIVGGEVEKLAAVDLGFRPGAAVMHPIERVFETERRPELALQHELAVAGQGAEIRRAHHFALFDRSRPPHAAARGNMREHRVALCARQAAAFTGTHCTSPLFCPACSTIRDKEASASSLAFSRWR